MRGIKLMLTLAAMVAVMAASALPETAQIMSLNCQLFLAEEEIGYFPNSNAGGPGYYDEVYGWHMWCQSPI
jgi:hypothetical protein